MAQEIPTPIQLLGRIGKTDEYLAHAAEAHSRDVDYETRRTARARGIGSGALKLTAEHTSENGDIDTEGRLFTLISAMEPFLQAELSIERDQQNNTYRRSEHLEDIAATIDFNTAIRELVDHNPSLTPTHVKVFIESAFVTSYGSKDAEFFMQSVNRRVIGMQHEIAFEQIVSHVEGVSYRQATKDEELLSNGADMFITVGEKTFPVDIKASQQKAEELNTKQLSFGLDTYRLWSHAYTKEFGDSFRLPYSIMMSRVDQLAATLQEAATFEYKQTA
jgi:uncharacterized protein YqkB